MEHTPIRPRPKAREAHKKQEHKRQKWKEGRRASEMGYKSR